MQSIVRFPGRQIPVPRRPKQGNSPSFSSSRPARSQQQFTCRRTLRSVVSLANQFRNETGGFPRAWSIRPVKRHQVAEAEATAPARQCARNRPAAPRPPLPSCPSALLQAAARNATQGETRDLAARFRPAVPGDDRHLWARASQSNGWKNARPQAVPRTTGARAWPGCHGAPNAASDLSNQAYGAARDR